MKKKRYVAPALNEIGTHELECVILDASVFTPLYVDEIENIDGNAEYDADNEYFEF